MHFFHAQSSCIAVISECFDVLIRQRHSQLSVDGNVPKEIAIFPELKLNEGDQTENDRKNNANEIMNEKDVLSFLFGRYKFSPNFGVAIFMSDSIFFFFRFCFCFSCPHHSYLNSYVQCLSSLIIILSFYDSLNYNYFESNFIFHRRTFRWLLIGVA